MAENSKIEWTDATWNPIRARLKGSERWGYHCERISPGCKHCYASTMNGRMLPSWGTGLDYTVPNREKVEVFLDEQELLKPLKWRKSKKIFPCSMTDWCADFVTDEMRDRILAVAALCPQHTFLFLTKRADRCAEYFSQLRMSGDAMDCKSAVRDAFRRPARFFPRAFSTLPLNNNSAFQWPLPNVLLGFSAENQEYFDDRWNAMRPLAAAGWKVWCSAEPLLGPIDLRIPLGASGPSGYPPEFKKWPEVRRDEWFKMQARATYISRAEMPSWVVAGGESGPGARPMNIAWARSIVQQCSDAGVACFVKQLGANVDGDWPEFPMWDADVNGYPIKDRKGGDMSEWPEDLRIRQFPQEPTA